VPAWLGLTVVLVMAAAVQLPVALDEAYYWTWSKALSWSYYDHPPGIAAAIAVARSIFGEGKLALRLISVGATLVTAGLVWSTCRRLVPQQPLLAGRLGLIGLSGSLLFVVGHLAATPDPLQGLSLALAAWMMVRALQPDPHPWVGAGAAAVLTAAVLFKHSTALLAGGALLVLLLDAQGRRALLRPQVLIGLGLGGLCLTPWLWTDLSSGDGATAFQAARVAHGGAQRGLLGLPLTLGALVLAWGPAAAVGSFGVWSRLAGRGPLAVRALGGGALALVLGCATAAYLGTGELNWLTPGLIFGLPAAVHFAVDHGARGVRGFAGASALTTLVSLVVLLHIVYPFAPLAAKKDRTMRAAGYAGAVQVAQQVAQQYEARLIVTRSYQMASQLRFHMQDALPVLEIGSKRRSQYDRWPRPSACPGDVVVVAWGRRDLPPGLQGERLGELVTAERSRAGRSLDPLFVQALKVTGRALCAEVEQ